jgi:serine/threonine protein kinase
MSLRAGDRIGGYEIRGQLGAGGMGEVYRATDSKLKRDMALKVLPPAFSNDRELMTRFQREAEMLASLNHPNIVAIYGVEDNALVMELVDLQAMAPLMHQIGYHLMTDFVAHALQLGGQLTYALASPA